MLIQRAFSRLPCQRYLCLPNVTARSFSSVRSSTRNRKAMNPLHCTTAVMHVRTITVADEARSFSEYTEVAEALQPYIDAAKLGDGELSRTAFFDHAHIVGTMDGEFFNETADDFKNAVQTIGPAPEIQHRIVWIDVSGPVAAAKVEFIHWGKYRFTDYFVLCKNGGQWKISGKVFHSHSNN